MINPTGALQKQDLARIESLLEKIGRQLEKISDLLTRIESKS